MLNEFIYKIFVHERDYKGVANSPQTIEIYYNFIGKFGTQEVNQPTEEERTEIAEKERLRKKRHEAYLRRKANGWQNAYYQKHKAAKKAAIDAKKEAIRAEDQGVFRGRCPHRFCRLAFPTHPVAFYKLQGVSFDL